MTTEQVAAPSGAHQQMSTMVTSHWVSQLIRAVVDLSIADHLADAALTADEIAEREGSAPSTTYRLMRACVSLGLMTADRDRRFHGTTLLDTLRTGAPGSLRGLALATTMPAQWLAWNAFTASVRAGETHVKDALGTDFFTYLEAHPGEAREFTDGMSSTTSLWASEAATVIATAGVRLAVDVGGANGSLLHLLQAADPYLEGIVLDRPGVVDDARAETARMGLTERTRVVAGDFFDSVPAADLYLLKFILHDWDDARCVQILENCRRAMLPGGRVLLIEILVGELANPGFGAMMDMNMLAIVPGQERSLSEYDALLAAAGLRRTAVLSTSSPQSVLEAIAVR